MKLKYLVLVIALSASVTVGSFVSLTPVSASSHGSIQQNGLTPGQQQVLQSIARQTWRFFDADTDPNTHLPMDNIGLYGAPARGTYTSPTNIGVYFWSVVAAQDLELVDPAGALQRATATLTEVEKLSK